MDKNLVERYKIHFINGKRYYEFNMSEMLPSLEDTVPYYFKYKDIEMLLFALTASGKKYDIEKDDFRNIDCYR